MKRNIKIAPSMLSSNFAKISDEIKEVENSGADLIHLDVMDGVFVPNITFGMKMVKDIREVTNLPLDCHLMIVNPEKYIEQFAKSGADYITVHYEACQDKLEEVLKLIKSFGVKCGMVINPNTSLECVKGVVGLCDMVLIMSVYPGFGGQKFIGEVLEKVKALRSIIDENGYNCLIEIDGGINSETATLAIDAGCDVLVAGNAFFGASDKSATVLQLRGDK